MDDWFFALLNYITNIADSAVLTAICAVTVAYLCREGLRREALSILLAYGLASISVGVLKVLFMICHVNQAHFSPSGHMALSVVVFGSCARLATRQLPKQYKLWPILFFILLISFIGLTRVWLGFHTLEDVIAGVLIGCLSIKIAWWGWFKRPQGNISIPFLMLCILIPIILLNGEMFPAESGLRMLALYIGTAGHFCAP